MSGPGLKMPIFAGRYNRKIADVMIGTRHDAALHDEWYKIKLLILHHYALHSVGNNKIETIQL
jgi:hypothetical protein